MAKQKLTPHQFFLILNGPSCGGKSTVSNVLFEECAGIFKAKSDYIKWLISDYEAAAHRAIVQDMTLGLIEIALKNGLSVLKEGALFEPEQLVQIAKKFHIPLFIANISAPREVLDQRFLERIESKKQGAKIANIDPKRFSELYEMYFANKMDSPLEFDSSQETPEAIAAAISKYIQAHI